MADGMGKEELSGLQERNANDQAPAFPSKWLKGLGVAKAVSNGTIKKEILSKAKQKWFPEGAFCKDSVSHHIQNALCSEGFVGLHQEAFLTYDTSKYDFVEHITDIIASIEPRARETGLSKLHLAFDPEFSREKSIKSKKSKLNGDLFSSELAQPFQALYRKFICEVVGPHVKDFLPDEEVLVFQAGPCLRIAPPSMHRIGHPHCDSMYYHQGGQINLWLPLTRTYGANTLWVESKPGKEDYHPLEAEAGQMVRFYGNRCTHFTVANDTDDTRVSLDFRIVPGSCYDPDPPESRGSNGPRFSIGGYYALARHHPSSTAWHLVSSPSAVPADSNPGPAAAASFTAAT